MSKSLFVLIALIIFSPVFLPAQDQELENILDHVSITSPENWQGVTAQQLDEYMINRPNTTIPALGTRHDVPGFFCFRYLENAEIIPTISLTMHSGIYLSTSDDALQYVRDTIEPVYTRQISSPFRAFSVEVADIGAYHGFKIIGVYRHRTNNVKIEQYLIPGNGVLFVLTYTNYERDFRPLYNDFLNFADSMHLQAFQFRWDWFNNFTSGLLTVLAIACLLAGIYYLYRIRPGGGGSLFGLAGRGGNKKNPFTK